MAQIFISYNRNDRPVAERFAKALEAMGHSVWWDAGLQVGEAYDEVTEAALRGAAAVVVLWSPRSVGSRWVRAEATFAQRQGSLFPAMIEPAERPVMFELTQTADLTNWTGARNDPAWLQFAADLDAFIAARLTNATKATAQAAPRPLSEAQLKSRGFATGPGRRGLLLAGAGLGLAAVAGGGVFVWNHQRTRGASRELSLAVLPFKNISGAADQDYFADGLSAELRAALTRVPALQVAAPRSSSDAVSDETDVGRIARKLGVAFLLQGSFARSGEVIRVGADLIDARQGLTRWSETYERALSDVFAVQEEIASKVAEGLAVEMVALDSDTGTPGQQDGAPRTVGGSTNVSAFEDYLHGREAFTLSSGEETDRRALAWFDSAISKDRGYAAAHAWRARTLAALSSQSSDPTRMRNERDAAIAAARLAISLAPTYAAAHTTLGWVLFNQALDARGARSAYGQARRLGPGDGDVLSAVALFNGRTGRMDEARRDIARTIVLDPINPSTFRFAGTIATIAGECEEALAHLDRALALNPAATVINALRGEAFACLDRWADARAAFASEPSAMFKLTGLAIADWKLGRRDEAGRAFEQLTSTAGDNALYQQAQILAQWGQIEPALDALEKAHSLFDAGIAQMFTDRFLEPVRTHPRFQSLLKTVGFV